MNIDEMKANGHKLINEFINNAKMDVADELFSPNFVNHSPEQGVTADLGGLKQYISMMHAAFSDFSATIEDMIAENDKVVVRMRVRGVHTGDFMGIAPTQKEIDTTTISIVRIDNGKIVERWNVTDRLEIARQLGIL
jgi:predicted ester cyclase